MTRTLTDMTVEELKQEIEQRGDNYTDLQKVNGKFTKKSLIEKLKKLRSDQMNSSPIS
jgi:hypothetical protein